MQGDVQLALVVIPVDQLIRPDIPHHDRSTAILALGNGSLELHILDRMVLGLHRKPLFVELVWRAFGDRPRFEDAVHLEPKVVMQIPRRVLLDHEATASGLARAGGRLRRLGEIALLPIGGERRLGSDGRRKLLLQRQDGSEQVADAREPLQGLLRLEV